jgi:hypothetical protein
MATNRSILVFAGAGAAAAALVAILAFRGSTPPKAETTPADSAPPPVASGPAHPSAPASSLAETSGDAGLAASGAPVDLGMALIAANRLSAAKAALAAGDPRKALAEIESYEKLPEANALKQETVVLKIEALSKVPGRKTDALALAMSTRDDPSYASYQPQIRALLQDAGALPSPPTAPPER